MYQSYFGMTQRPFGSTPQLSAYFPAGAQEEALATLRYAVTQGRGIGLLTGPPGTGKTIVCHRLTTTLERGFTTAMITNTNLATTKALLQAILYDLTLPYHGMDEQELRLTLTDFLLSKYAGGGRTVLIIDEAQNLTISLLEEVRMLGNLEGEMDKLLQIVLVGQPRLVEALRQPELEALNQRIGARGALRALTEDETDGYIRHQLQCAGAVPDHLFTPDAVAAVYEATAGVPRLINQLCEHTLLLAYVAEANKIDAETVEEASADLNRMAEQDITEAPARVVPSAAERSSAAPRSTPGASTPVAPAEDESDSLSHDDGTLEIIWTTSGSLEPALPTQAARRDADHPPANTGVRTEPAWTESGAPLLGSGTGAVASLGKKETGDAGKPAPHLTRHPLEEVFEQEEYIVDQYAALDEAKKTRRAPRQAYTPAPPRAEDEDDEPLIQIIRSEPARAPRRLPDPDETVPVEAADDTMPISFVEPASAAASFEVGAEIDELAPAPTPTPTPSPAPADSEILIIEEGSKRIPSNRGRVDVPQPPGARGPGAYRRLFTHARRG